MANFNESYGLLKDIEFTSPSDFMHYNKGEKTYTIGGVYPYTKLKCKDKINRLLNITESLVHASIEAYYDNEIQLCIKEYYYINYWAIYNLGKLPQHVANEIFIFGLHTGNMKKAIKMAQEIIGAKPDGIIGKETIAKANSYNQLSFSFRYDEKEVKFYSRLVQKTKSLLRYLYGWIVRAYKV